MAVINASCHDWFVIQVKTSKEFFIKDFVEKHANEKIKMIIFSRELVFERKNRQFKCLSPLFPSYLFVHKKADKVVEIIKRNFADEFIRPLCFKEKERKCKVCFQETSPCMVAEHEMDFFLSAADTTGVISLSCGIQKENEIKIVNGPLKYLNNKIIWINQKKKKACVEVELFKQKMKVNLGFEMLDVS